MKLRLEIEIEFASDKDPSESIENLREGLDANLLHIATWPPETGS